MSSERSRSHRWVLAAIVATAWTVVPAGRIDILQFAAEMAAAGNWREAQYRWSQLAQERPDDARILNNLAVAEEVLGSPTDAGAIYDRAARLAPKDAVIRANVARSDRFWSRARGEPLDPLAARAMSPERVKPGKNALRVEVALAVPPKLDLADRKTILVASFLTGDDEILDSNREMVRFLRREVARRTPLDVLDISPPPAVPEQAIDQLAANAEFWKYLGKRHDADVIVSGWVGYDRRDASGFRDVDIVSPTTRQKVRTTRFTEAEDFLYTVDLLFLDGKSGEVLYRDRLSKKVTYTGVNNDPLAAFFDISQSLADDVLSMISPRRKIDERIIYKG